MTSFEVPEPILNSPYLEPAEHWQIEEGKQPLRERGRRPAGYFFRDPRVQQAEGEHEARGEWKRLDTVNLIRERIAAWRKENYPGTSRTTLELLRYWQREGRRFRLFFAQLEAAETVIFLTEARQDFRHGIQVPLDEPGKEQQVQGAKPFYRYACKMATGSGKTTVMGMLAAWSILNKVNDRRDARFSDVVLVVCPNVTIRQRLDTVGRTGWPTDTQGRPVYPEGFEELATKLDRPLHPPGRDVRCIVSVSMLTEGWDCNTVTHIVGLRPFMSQLLCEQVVGRGLRRTNYEIGEDGKLTEEVAKVFGVPFEVIPFKESKKGKAPPPPKRHHVHAEPAKERLAITFPRVDGYCQAIRNQVVVDWEVIAQLRLDPGKIPPEVEMKAALPNNKGRPSLSGPGKLESVDLSPFRKGRRLQELVFGLARDLTRDYVRQPECQAPAHVLFPQVMRIVERFLKEKVKPVRPAEVIDVFLSPYYGWVIERLSEAIKPDASAGEVPELPRYEKGRGPGSTAEVDFWTSKDVREVVRSHVNYVVADTKVWEQSAAYRIDTHPHVEAFVKNAGLGFAIPYLHNGQAHDYVPDFVIRLKEARDRYLILETKGFDPLAEVKEQAARRWTAAVNADGKHGHWQYALARKPDEVESLIEAAAEQGGPDQPMLTAKRIGESLAAEDKQ